MPKSQPALYHGAVLFSQRCSGCHTLAFAATHGSASNPRTATAISGPNFNVRCERPITRVMYAIINGGFSGAYMPQNVVVGQDAVDVAKFVATYAGRLAPKTLGVLPCVDKPIGTIPPQLGTGGGATAAAAATSTTSTAVAAAPPKKKAGANKKAAHS